MIQANSGSKENIKLPVLLIIAALSSARIHTRTPHTQLFISPFVRRRSVEFIHSLTLGNCENQTGKMS